MSTQALDTKTPVSKFRLSGGASGIVIALIVIIVALGVASPRFLSVGNLTDITRQAVFVAIIAFGATLVIAMRGIDLSVGSTLAFTGLIAADLMNRGLNPYLSVGASLAVGTLIGIVNGVLVAKVKIADFIVTMAMMVITRGLIMVYTEGIPLTGLSNPSFQVFGQGFVGFVPMPVLVTILTFAAVYFLLYQTRFGRYTLSIGSNPEAARLVGIRIDRIKIAVYALTGYLAALSGVLLTSRLEAAMPEAGEGYELDVIAAVVMGGTSLAGGRASLLGTAAGAVLMAVVRNGLNILNVNTFWHQVVIGAIILLAVCADKFGGRSRDT
ncbi:ribose transport system permease protein [Bradyrhizobium sp. Ghvi]|uniref:ABC transporter permease n=1 Tax=Bradyrhizobium sp. Ghvi TaxID=1855319 RepID=UPI0008E0FD7E|nr:ribose ABC transporter permease [Bradyrhizobium sp. Ghvi]SFO93852.1 ribose transport system permease protein [Bradyrhizobium sp. Ghvi]